jgi:protease PrsW
MTTLFIASLLPGLAISAWIYAKDKYEKEPKSLLVWSFVWGCISTIPAMIGQMYFRGLENPEHLLNITIFSFLVVGLTEELSKFLFLRFYAYPKEAFNEPIDGIVYAVMVGMGFATFENILYVFSSDKGGWPTAIGRAVTAVPAHAAFAVLMGAFVGLAKFTPEKRDLYMWLGVSLAVFFHGLYDVFLLQKSYQGLMFLSIIALVLSIILSKRLIRKSQELSPFKNGVIQVQNIENEDIKNSDII